MKRKAFLKIYEVHKIMWLGVSTGKKKKKEKEAKFVCNALAGKKSCLRV